MLIFIRIFVVNKLYIMSEIKIEVHGEYESGKTTVVELIKELFDMYGVNVIVEGDNSCEGSKRDRTIKLINSIKSVTVKEVHEEFNTVLKNI